MRTVSDILPELNVLYVEDDKDVIDILESRLLSRFNIFTPVSTAEDALELFKTKKYDMILTDYLLPNMNGLELAKEIFKINPRVPVILITGYVDMEFLIEAINLGINQFVTKPIRFKLLENAINKAVEDVIIRKILELAKEKELEYYKFRDYYNNTHHDMLFRKELHIMRNDTFKQIVKYGDKPEESWILESFYKNMEAVSGDAFSIRQVDGGVLLVIADAMGKGVSASITSLLSVTIMNYQVSTHNRTNKSFNFDHAVQHSMTFLKEYLVENEVLSIVIVHLDTKNEKLHYASCSMPRILYQTRDGSTHKITSNNIPIMSFTERVKIDTIDVSNIDKFLISTDGVIESHAITGALYSDYFDKDFTESSFIKNFKQNMMHKLETFEDDVTIFMVRRPFTNIIKYKHFMLPTKFEEIDRTSKILLDEAIATNIDPNILEDFIAAFTDALFNAYEHGNLAIDINLKHNLIASDEYEAELKKREVACHKQIEVEIYICQDIVNKYIVASVRDEGAGYPQDVIRNAIFDPMRYNGRGIKIIDFYTDSFFFSPDRRTIYICKEIK